MIEVQDRNRMEMSQRERDILKVMQPVLDGKRTQAEAARLLKLSVQHVRRIQKKLEEHGDAAIVHGLRGKPPNHQHDPALRTKVLRAYQKRYRDFGPTFACEKLADKGLVVGVETLRRWLLKEGLGERRRKCDPHRSRRPRRNCFGERVQMDASIHDWLEGRGEEIVLNYYDRRRHGSALGPLLSRQHGRNAHGSAGSMAAEVRSAAGSVHRPAQHLRAARERPTTGRSRCQNAVRASVGGVEHRVNLCSLSTSQRTGRAFVRHSPGSVCQGTASGQGQDVRGGQRSVGEVGTRAQPTIRQACSPT
jgi:hypothetical protein